MLTHIQAADSIYIRADGEYSSKGKKSFLYNALSHATFSRLFFMNIADGSSLINLFTDLRSINNFASLSIVNCSTSKMFDAAEYFDKIRGIYLRNVRAQNVLNYLNQIHCMQISIDGGGYGLTEYDNQLYVGHILNNAPVLRTLHVDVKSKNNFQYFSRFFRIFKPRIINYGYVCYTDFNGEIVKYHLSYAPDETGKRKLVRNLQTTNVNALYTVLEEVKPEHLLVIDSLNVTFKDLNQNNLNNFAAMIKKHTELKQIEIKTTSSLLLHFWTHAFDIISHIPNITLGEIGKDDSHNILQKSTDGCISSLGVFLMNTQEYQLFDLNKFIATVDGREHLQRVGIKTPLGQSMAIWPRVYNSIAHIPHITLTEIGEDYSQNIIEKSIDGKVPSLSLFLTNAPEYQQFDLGKLITVVDTRNALQRVDIKTPYGQSAAVWSRVFNLINHIPYITLSEVGKDYSQKIIEMSMSALSLVVTNSEAYQLFDDMQNITIDYRGPFSAASHEYYSQWLASSTNVIYLTILDANFALLAKTLNVIVNTNVHAWANLKQLTASISFLDKYYLINVMNAKWFGSLESFNFYTKDEAEAMSVFDWFRSYLEWNENVRRNQNEVLSIRKKPQLYGREYL